LKNTNNATATIPSETTVGTRFSEVLFKSKFFLKSLLNSLRLCLLSLFGFVLTSIEYSFV
jgi:ABC-type maltose transport system permease subunit